MMSNPLRPVAEGLYLPQFEHDACGVGMICHLKGEKSHEIIKNGLQILMNLEHRGAAGSDDRTGDGAGILMQIPHDFMKRVSLEAGWQLPDEANYGVGLVFLPQDSKEREYCKLTFEQIVKGEEQEFIGWRRVPTVSDAIGRTARTTEPYVEQIFIGKGKSIKDNKKFERKLFVIRKVMARTIRESNLKQKQFFYIPSLSCNTIVYKGMLLADQVDAFYPDLKETDMRSGLAIVHQRYSTNTFPSWDLAQPFRFLAHNGEINTLRGNMNWLTARQHLFQSPLFGDDIKKILPILTQNASDSAILDNALELLYHTGRSLPHAVMMLIPEAWQNHNTMPDERKAFYEYHSCMMEPWDGPASIPFTDGHVIGAVLDRNGLRPSRYLVTKDDFVIMGSETGALQINPANISYKGRLEPGKMFLIDTDQGRIIDNEEIKTEMSWRKPYRSWLKDNMVKLDKLPKPEKIKVSNLETLVLRQRLFGFTVEDLKFILSPMAEKGQEPVGSMGSDIPLAILSSRPQLLFNYFKQLFAQVTNPPLDAIREKLVTSMVTNLGAEKDLFQETPEHAAQLKLDQPILTNEALEKIRELNKPHLSARTLHTLFKIKQGGDGLRNGIDDLCQKAEQAIRDGGTLLILSDRKLDQENAPIPILLAASGVHHYLIRKGLRTKCGIIVESGEPREVHHFSVLFGYGVGAVNPYLAFETIEQMVRKEMIADIDLDKAIVNYIKAINNGILKVMSKMGISTLHSYRGAQIFESIGLQKSVIDEYFTWTASRIGGLDLGGIAKEVEMRHNRAYVMGNNPEFMDLDQGGVYQWRRNGEHHLFNPLTVAKLQQSTRENNRKIYDEYAQLINDQSQKLSTLRGMLEFNLQGNEPVPIEEVESIESIVKRFKTGAMSYGSLSKEVHETLAIAMNRLGGRSNSGEGGEDSDRYIRMNNGDLRRSAIKQVASGRFGVTSNYLVNANELQIKISQGAKPGEGGQLPSEKVYPWIAKVRNSTPYVSLISPPPHHDIYSIEDIAQLIHDLKNANDKARINVKLVSEVGVGTVAAGVVKGKADVVLISGWDGGTGASPQTSLKHAGLPWELGLSETHQTLIKNDLRSRVVVEVDGQLKTGRDVAIACLLGAEEFGFATAPLVVCGCVMMRVCHLNTCSTGVATQDPELRKKFSGKPEYVINFFHFIAQDLREIMASLGYRTINEMVGQSQRLRPRADIENWKAKQIDFSRILHKPETSPEVGIFCTQGQYHGLDKALDNQLINLVQPALKKREKVVIDQIIKNTNRTVGTMLSAEITRLHGEEGLDEDTIIINCKGSAGQSFGAFAAHGLTLKVEGDANDYLGKGLSGGKLIVYPPKQSSFNAEENILIGNVALYGATSGQLFVRGKAGERFCVRNSGATAVVEGVGDHGCEYMTGGIAVILGATGRNFAAGMSGGIAYVLDESGLFARHNCNMEMVELEGLVKPDEVSLVHELVERHFQYTGSDVARRILNKWSESLHHFVKVMPIEYKRALLRLAEENKEPLSVA